jgi:hypothetical protein
LPLIKEGVDVAGVCAGAEVGLGNENDGVEDADTATGGFVSPPLAKGELTGGALKSDFGAVDDAPGRENPGFVVAVVASSVEAGVSVILGTVGGAASFALSSSFFLFASRILIIAFASKSCFSHFENCLYVRGLRKAVLVLSVRLGLTGTLLLLLPPELLRKADAIRRLAELIPTLLAIVS